MVKKYFPAITLIISLTLLFYTFYRSEIIWKGDRREYYFIYYIISIFLIFFSIILFFISKKVKEYLLIFITSSFFFLYTIEGSILFFGNETLINKNSIYSFFKINKKNKYDKRTKLEIYKDKNSLNKKTTIAFLPQYYLKKNYSLFPLSGISNIDTIHCNENGYYSIYKSDRYGFNNPDLEWDSSKIEYLLIGDSFVHGACVNRPNDISSILRKLSNKSVLNLGYNGNGPLIEYALLREYLNFNVSKVLWFYFEGNDLNELNIEIKNKILKKYIRDLNFKQNLKYHQNKIDQLNISNLDLELEKLENVQDKKKRVQFHNFFKFVKLYHLRQFVLPKKKIKSKLSKDLNITVQAQTITDFKNVLTLTKELTKKNNSKLYFVYLPTYYRYKFNYLNSSYISVKKIVNDLNIPFIDIHKEVFEKEKNPLKLFPNEENGHFTIEGYKKVSDIIYKFTN